MDDMTVIWALIGAVIGIVVGHLIFILFDVYRMNKVIKRLAVERERIEAERARYRAMTYEERAKTISGSSFIVLVSRSISDMQKRNLENQDDKTG